MKNKIETALKIEQPQNQTQVRVFLGAVTFYRALWPRRSYGQKGIPNHLAKANLSTEAMSTYQDLNLPTIQETIN